MPTRVLLVSMVKTPLLTLKAVVEVFNVSAALPEVEVNDKAPVVKVKPLLAVKVEAEVMVPLPVVAMVPEVERLPAELIVKAPPPVPTENRAEGAVVPMPTRVLLLSRFKRPDWKLRAVVEEAVRPTVAALAKVSVLAGLVVPIPKLPEVRPTLVPVSTRTPVLKVEAPVQRAT